MTRHELHMDIEIDAAPREVWRIEIPAIGHEICGSCRRPDCPPECREAFVEVRMQQDVVS